MGRFIRSEPRRRIPSQIFASVQILWMLLIPSHPPRPGAGAGREGRKSQVGWEDLSDRSQEEGYLLKYLLQSSSSGCYLFPAILEDLAQEQEERVENHKRDGKIYQIGAKKKDTFSNICFSPAPLDATYSLPSSKTWRRSRKRG